MPSQGSITVTPRESIRDLCSSIIGIVVTVEGNPEEDYCQFCLRDLFVSSARGISLTRKENEGQFRYCCQASMMCMLLPCPSMQTEKSIVDLGCISVSGAQPLQPEHLGVSGNRGTLI